jgi:hypothetical protein
MVDGSRSCGDNDGRLVQVQSCGERLCGLRIKEVGDVPLGTGVKSAWPFFANILGFLTLTQARKAEFRTLVSIRTILFAELLGTAVKILVAYAAGLVIT